MEQLSPDIFEFINKYVPKENILLDEPMSRHTTFRVGGNAKALVKIGSSNQLSTLIPYLIKIGEPYYVKGNGSNIIVGDKGYNGVILEVSNEFGEIFVDGTKIVCEAGALMSSVAKTALDNSLTGFEFASGIPGSIGGGVVMNAGAYGGELANVVSEVTVVKPDGEEKTFRNEELRFGYRTSLIKMRPYIVTKVSLELREGKKDDIFARMEELKESRKQKQPLEYPSAGSTFKRPEGYFAGKLIMDAGLRGYSIGGAAVSDKHCGFVINKGNATAADVYEVIVEVQEKVKEKFGVNLEPEVIFLGTF